jgi:hypothetical protein
LFALLVASFRPAGVLFVGIIRTRRVVAVALPLPVARGPRGPRRRMTSRGRHLRPIGVRAAIRCRNGFADQFLDITQQAGFFGIA